ncbi:Acyl-CoA oxidase [Mycena venus]|uniref:Acyl-CoA oxidase n=1 Tax=Mycena venus TaxID=2733690 RepID=A0A8H6X714_9AGAR|nr:Acyl-CoA oxidase [Mycena venus]
MVFSSHSALAKHPLFTVLVEGLSVDERVALAYKRARIVLQTHNLSALDVQQCSQRFWGLFTDPIICFDLGMFTILAAHVGLAIGTLSRHLQSRPDLQPLVDEFLRFEKVGLFLLTERGHGTDSFNIETTATRLADGSYILNTPREEASKFMPASTPSFGISKVALVMARLMENGQDFGCRYFVVPICNEKEMFRGVTSTRLPPRSGTSPLDFAITSFHNVRLPATALISSTPFKIAAPSNPLASWWDENWRIQRGTLLIVSPMLHSIKMAAYIVGNYSLRRCITDRQNVLKPIFEFRTQQWPIASAVAMGGVYEMWYKAVIHDSIDGGRPQHIQHALAVICKTTIMRHGLRIIPELAERCGAQGTFEPNFMARIQNDAVGGIIAEGELTTLCIRLFSELLLGRYNIDMPSSGESLLSQHAHRLLEENRKLLVKFGGHRSAEFNSIILPQSQAVIEAIGHALAYAAALENKIPQPLLDMYECAVMRLDPAWYCEAGISRLEQRLREDRAISFMLPDIKLYLSDLNVADLVTAPIVDDESWKRYAASLPTFAGNIDVGPIARL